MRNPPRLLTILAVWFIAEFLALMLVVHWIGWTGALVLGLAISFLGFRQLSALGQGAAQNLRQAMAQGTMPQTDMLDSMMAAMGAFLMILPGFLSDIVGLALTAPSARQYLARYFGGGGRQRSRQRDEVIELNPEDWHSIERPDNSPRRP